MLEAVSQQTEEGADVPALVSTQRGLMDLLIALSPSVAGEHIPLLYR